MSVKNIFQNKLSNQKESTIFQFIINKNSSKTTGWFMLTMIVMYRT